MSRRWITKHEEDNSRVAKEITGKTDPSIGEWFGTKPISWLLDIEQIVGSNNGTPSTGRALPWLCPCTYINRFCKNDFVIK